MFEINGVELEFNVNDLEVAEIFYEKNDEVIVAATIIGEAENAKSRIEAFKHTCNKIHEMYDAIFGEGTAVSVIKNKYDLVENMEAFEVLINDKLKQDAKLDEVSARMQKIRAGNRAARRTAGK